MMMMVMVVRLYTTELMVFVLVVFTVVEPIADDTSRDARVRPTLIFTG